MASVVTDVGSLDWYMPGAGAGYALTTIFVETETKLIGPTGVITGVERRRETRHLLKSLESREVVPILGESSSTERIPPRNTPTATISIVDEFCTWVFECCRRPGSL